MTPLELTGFARAAGLRRQSVRGMVYDPFRRDWRRSSDTGVNYLFSATKPDVQIQSSIAFTGAAALGGLQSFRCAYGNGEFAAKAVARADA